VKREDLPVELRGLEPLTLAGLYVSSYSLTVARR